MPQVVYRAIYTDVNARVQSLALQLGEVDYISELEAEAIEETGPLQIERTWDYWKGQILQ